MLLKIPPASEVVPGTEYSGFTLVESSDPEADNIGEIDSELLFLARPGALVYNNDRAVLNAQGHILGIALAFVLEENPECIPASFKSEHRGRPIKLITSTLMLSEFDKRVYVAYFYFNSEGRLMLSFIADDWSSTFPSPAIPFR